MTTSPTPPAQAQADRPLVLEMRGIDKRFPGVHALRGVDLRVARGEILGLVGENGAGKSTLIKILSGAYQSDAGSVAIDGRPVGRSDPHAMLDQGVAVIYQEPSLADHLTVGENIFMGRLPRRGLVIDWPRVRADTAALSEQLGLHLEPGEVVGRLSVARRQMVEIAKALSREARLLVLDEPSAVLGDVELEGLFRVMRRLAAQGVGLVYISHRLNEVYRITDRVTVMKDGQVVADAPTSSLGPDDLVRLMVGRDLGDVYGQPRAGGPGPVALRVHGLERRGVLHGIDLEVREGEILGLAGLAGSGRTEVLRAIHGADPIDAGEVEVHGRRLRIHSPRDAIAAGIGLLTEDRKADGLLLLGTLAFNVTIARMADIQRRGVLRMAAERSMVQDYIGRLTIRTPGPAARVSGLSGGNQQKVIFAKWLNADCRVLLVDEPTRGVDVGAKREIYQLMRGLTAHGTAIIMVSSELPEILGMSDRILVMREGRIAAQLARVEATEETIMYHCTRAAA
jgi:ribose transport system ATP-binding protein